MMRHACLLLEGKGVRRHAAGSGGTAGWYRATSDKRFYLLNLTKKFKKNAEPGKRMSAQPWMA